MNLVKLTRWTINVLILVVIGLTAFQLFFQLTVARPEGSGIRPAPDTTGATSMTSEITFNNRLFDFNYFFVFRDGETLMNGYFVVAPHIKLRYDYRQADRSRFIEVNSAGETFYVPNITDKLHFPLPPEKVNDYYWVSVAVLIAGALLVLIQLIWARRLIRNFGQGDFFSKSNFDIIYRFGLLYIAKAFSVFFFYKVLYGQLSSDAISLPEGYRMTTIAIEFPWGALLTGLVILVLAGAFKEGVRLKEEQSLTI